MRKNFGFTFLELIIVIGLIGILASFTMMSSKDTSKTYSLLAEAESAASKISLVVAEAQSSQSSVKLICDSKSLSAQYFRGQKSNTVYSFIGQSAITATSGTPTKTVSIIDYATNVTPQNSTLVLTCSQFGCSSGNKYITSDGSLLNTSNCAAQGISGGDSLYLIFYSTQNPSISSQVSFSATGYPRIYLQNNSINSVPREIIN